MERYVVVVQDTYGRETPFVYGPFDTAILADEWIAAEQHSEGVVASDKATVSVLNLP